MPMLEHHNRMFAYNRWSNGMMLAALREAMPRTPDGGLRAPGAVASTPGGAPRPREAPPPRSLRFMAHIVAAERLWLGRLRRDKSPVVVWPDLTLDQCDAGHAEIALAWEDLLAGLDEGSLSDRVEYVNSKGEPWTSAVDDILTHVVIHSAYHRGQIATDMRASGLTPVYTDFIHAVRQGLVR